jgi:hypothetical protein
MVAVAGWLCNGTSAAEFSGRPEKHGQTAAMTSNGEPLSRPSSHRAAWNSGCIAGDCFWPSAGKEIFRTPTQRAIKSRRERFRNVPELGPLTH